MLNTDYISKELSTAIGNLYDSNELLDYLGDVSVLLKNNYAESDLDTYFKCYPVRMNSQDFISEPDSVFFNPEVRNLLSGLKVRLDIYQGSSYTADTIALYPYFFISTFTSRHDEDRYFMRSWPQLKTQKFGMSQSAFFQACDWVPIEELLPCINNPMDIFTPQMMLKLKMEQLSAKAHGKKYRENDKYEKILNFLMPYIEKEKLSALQEGKKSVVNKL